ncbi:hypothetical protein LINPERHAP1_LOCUS37796, partial [Linum perenne]
MSDLLCRLNSPTANESSKITTSSSWPIRKFPHRTFSPSSFAGVFSEVPGAAPAVALVTNRVRVFAAAENEETLLFGTDILL